MPDRRIADGEVIEGDGWALEAIATPGHTANHMAYALRGTDVLFSGDHVMGWSTSIVAPPDGAMSDYMASLEQLAQRPETTYLPGHGDAIRDAPAFVAHYIRHRHGREASILHRLAKGEADIPTMVRASLYRARSAARRRGRALDPRTSRGPGGARHASTTDGAPSIVGVYRLAG